MWRLRGNWPGEWGASSYATEAVHRYLISMYMLPEAARAFLKARL